jgi:hypothetical protein
LAEREWRRVQVERPRSSTSGGQSGGGLWAGWGRVEETGRERVDFLVCAAQSAKEVQERQLEIGSVCCLEVLYRLVKKEAFTVSRLFLERRLWGISLALRRWRGFRCLWEL